MYFPRNFFLLILSLIDREKNYIREKKVKLYTKSSKIK